MRISTLLGVLLLLCSCRAPRTESSQAVVDHTDQLLRHSDAQQLRMELAGLLGILADGHTDEEIKERILIDLFYVEDHVKSELRGLVRDGGPLLETARGLLWFLGDREDVAEGAAEFGLDPNDVEIGRADLGDALLALREMTSLPEGQFRISSIVLNRRMDKAYVRVEVGHGALKAAGMGFMFHRTKGLWRMVWQRYEWVS